MGKYVYLKVGRWHARVWLGSMLLKCPSKCFPTHTHVFRPIFSHYQRRTINSEFCGGRFNEANVDASANTRRENGWYTTPDVDMFLKTHKEEKTIWNSWMRPWFLVLPWSVKLDTQRRRVKESKRSSFQVARSNHKPPETHKSFGIFSLCTLKTSNLVLYYEMKTQTFWGRSVLSRPLPSGARPESMFIFRF